MIARMFGGAVPDLATTPCPACEKTVDVKDVVWDPYHQGDHQLSALPYHRACATRLLPPSEPTEAMRTCGLCSERFTDSVFEVAFAALHDRFRRAKPEVATPEVVWRLVSREPREFLAEHFRCLLDKVR